MPLWSNDGKELFYRGPGWVMAVPIQTDDGFAAGTPQRLYEDLYYRGIRDFPSCTYDIDPGGGFLMIEPDEPVETERIHVVLNWTQELERLVPAGR